ncbi:DegT/DnrJ/EryC1/StrS family aminotransferase [Roseivirga sp.]|uniref:DegT/DnrJ/EryC1/StrS family aminotransferase n=1 Tax=Roseivirga sp. TaxID=1964215 RepID=UPI003B51D5A3
MKFPIYVPSIGQREEELVLDCIRSTWISSRGKYIDLFEKALCESSGSKHAIAMHNGTHPLHIACLLSGAKSGKEVILPVFTYVASANSVLYCNAKPVFVDVNEDDWNINTQLVSSHISSDTVAIMPVDIYGYPADYNALRVIVSGSKIKLIADAAESFGATYHGQQSGSLGDLNSFSFFGNKTITTGEGGALLLNSDDWNTLARQLKNQGNSNTERYFHDVLGYNYRMTNIQAAIGLAQLERANEIVRRKKEIYHRYKTNLESYVTFQKEKKGVSSSNWLISFCLPTNVDREKFCNSLEAVGIETRPFFRPMDELPYFPSGNYPVAKEISMRGVSIPSYPALSDEDVDYISERILDAIKTK